MQKISTHLWFDKEAKEAAALYTATFPDSQILSSTTLSGTPSGDVDIVTVLLAGQKFTLLSAGPLFKFTPAISFLVACDTKEEVDAIWAKLSEGGTALMPLGAYPFSAHYGWTQDKFGLSWQVMLMGEIPYTQKITPTLMFVGKNAGKAEEAMQFYTSVFHDAKIGGIMRYGEGEAPDTAGSIKHAELMLEKQVFAAMDSAHEHKFTFTEAISFMVHCETQEEMDYYWEKLTAVPDAEACGWLKDQFGVSWQIVPNAMDEMMSNATPEQRMRVTQSFLKMKKFNLAELQRAYEGTA